MQKDTYQVKLQYIAQFLYILDEMYTHVALDEIWSVWHEVLRPRHVFPLFDPDEVLHRVQALLEAAGGQKVVHGHGIAEVKRHHLVMGTYNKQDIILSVGVGFFTMRIGLIYLLSVPVESRIVLILIGGQGGKYSCVCLVGTFVQYIRYSMLKAKAIDQTTCKLNH